MICIEQIIIKVEKKKVFFFLTKECFSGGTNSKKSKKNFFSICISVIFSRHCQCWIARWLAKKKRRKKSYVLEIWWKNKKKREIWSVFTFSETKTVFFFPLLLLSTFLLNDQRSISMKLLLDTVVNLIKKMKIFSCFFFQITG